MKKLTAEEIAQDIKTLRYAKAGGHISLVGERQLQVLERLQTAEARVIELEEMLEAREMQAIADQSHADAHGY